MWIERCQIYMFGVLLSTAYKFKSIRSQKIKKNKTKNKPGFFVRSVAVCGLFHASPQSFPVCNRISMDSQYLYLFSFGSKENELTIFEESMLC